jgi:hypothetical protein
MYKNHSCINKKTAKAPLASQYKKLSAPSHEIRTHTTFFSKNHSQGLNVIVQKDSLFTLGLMILSASLKENYYTDGDSVLMKKENAQALPIGVFAALTLMATLEPSNPAPTLKRL